MQGARATFSAESLLILASEPKLPLCLARADTEELGTPVS